MHYMYFLYPAPIRHPSWSSPRDFWNTSDTRINKLYMPILARWWSGYSTVASQQEGRGFNSRSPQCQLRLGLLKTPCCHSLAVLFPVLFWSPVSCVLCFPALPVPVTVCPVPDCSFPSPALSHSSGPCLIANPALIVSTCVSFPCVLSILFLWQMLSVLPVCLTLVRVFITAHWFPCVSLLLSLLLSSESLQNVTHVPFFLNPGVFCEGVVRAASRWLLRLCALFHNLIENTSKLINSDIHNQFTDWAQRYRTPVIGMLAQSGAVIELENAMLVKRKEKV